MDKADGFDPALGIPGLPDGRREIGRKNFPAAARLLPESSADSRFARIRDRTGGSGLMERFAPYLSLDLQHRELLSPDVFFESLERAAESFQKEREKEEPHLRDSLAAAERTLREALGDKELCEMLRNLVLKV